MKVTVTFGDTAVVVPCKAGWNVRDLMEQATRRYRRILEQVKKKPRARACVTSHASFTLLCLNEKKNVAPFRSFQQLDRTCESRDTCGYDAHNTDVHSFALSKIVQ